MFRKPTDKEQAETPQRRLEDGVGLKETAIAHGTKIQGKIQGRASVKVAGTVEGEVNVESVVWIEKQGEIQGTVSALGVIIEGELTGDILSSEKIEVRSGGRVIGNIKCNKLALAEGCFFQGEIKMSGEESRPVTFVEKRTSAKDEGEPEPTD